MRSPEEKDQNTALRRDKRAIGACKTTLVNLQDTAENNDNNSPGCAANLTIMRMTE